MKIKRIPELLLQCALLSITASLFVLTSCASNEELQARQDRRTDAYQSFQDRRKIRTDARQERTDAWFDRVMH